MIKQSIPTKIFTGLACASGSFGTVAFLFALLTVMWFSHQNPNHIPTFVLGSLSYGLMLSLITLSTGIAIARRSRHALLLVVTVTVFNIGSYVIWSRLYDMPMTVFSPKVALAVLFLAWMIFRRTELLKEETQPDN